MKKNLSLIFLFLTVSGYAQQITVLEGDLVALKGQKFINSEFTYIDMRVGGNDNEGDFVLKKRNEFNAREAGRGDRWAEAWVENRTKLYEPKFQQLFEKNAKLTITDSSAQFTMIVHTVYSNVGVSTGFWIIPTFFIDLEITFVETRNHNNVISKVIIMTCPGRNPSGVFYETGLGLQEAYAKAGKEVGAFLAKKMKK